MMEQQRQSFWDGLTFWEKVDELLGTAANLAMIAAATRYLGLW